MLGVAGILAQELVHPDVFWYRADLTVDSLPFDITGLVGVELFLMHWVESKRGYDVLKPGSQDQDPVFGNYKLPPHDVGYPGGVFAPFVPGNIEELKLKEIKNGRLAMLAFIGFTMAAQTTGLNPLAALGQHLSDPMCVAPHSVCLFVCLGAPLLSTCHPAALRAAHLTPPRALLPPPRCAGTPPFLAKALLCPAWPCSFPAPSQIPSPSRASPSLQAASSRRCGPEHPPPPGRPCIACPSLPLERAAA